MMAKKEMIRVIKTPEEKIELDASGKKNGRGAYICFKKECLLLALKNKGLERSLKTKIPQEIYNELEEELEQLENG